MSDTNRSQGKEAVRLCQHIVRQAFGNVICRVASVLLNRGRLSLVAIHRLAGLPMQTTAASLLILMQHHLVQTTCMALSPNDEASTSTSASNDDQYEFDIRECLYRLRLGRILTLTLTWPGFGQNGAVAEEIVRSVIMYGRIKVRDVAPTLGAEGDARRATAVHATLIKLVYNRFLIPTSPELQVLKSEVIDRRYKARKRSEIQKSVDKVITGPKMQELKRAVINDVEEERDMAVAPDKALIESKKIHKKSSKRKQEDEWDLRQEVYLRINHDRYGILMRDDLIAKAAEDKWNVGSGIIMRAVLNASFDQGAELRDANTKPPVTFARILSEIPNWAEAELRRGIWGAESRAINEVIAAYLDIMAGKDQMFTNNGAFLDERASGDNTLYAVAVERVCVRLREGLLAQMVRQKVDQKAARVLAVVTKAKIASEQTVRDCAMLPLKDARVYLARLNKLALIETTEVPKTAAKRIAGATGGMDYHLWSVDLPRVYNNLLGSIYKTIANAMQRRHAELEKRSVALDKEVKAVKHERDGLALRKQEAMQYGLPMPADQLGDPRQHLTGKDREELHELDEATRKLMLGIERCDAVAFVLGELPGWPGTSR